MGKTNKALRVLHERVLHDAVRIIVGGRRESARARRNKVAEHIRELVGSQVTCDGEWMDETGAEATRLVSKALLNYERRKR